MNTSNHALAILKLYTPQTYGNKLGLKYNYTSFENRKASYRLWGISTTSQKKRYSGWVEGMPYARMREYNKTVEKIILGPIPLYKGN